MDLRVDVASRLDREYAKVFEALPSDFMDLTDIVAVRERTRAATQARKPPIPEGVTVADVVVPGYDEGPEVKVRTYRPDGLPAGAAAFYWMHAGGMVLGDLDMDDFSCSSIAAQLGVLVVSVEYRLAPEHPFPAQIDDAYAGLLWLHGNAAALGVDPDRIAIGGASAGGGLAASLALVARDRGVVRPIFQYLTYPMLDDRHLTPSSTAVTDLRVWNHEASLLAWQAFLGPDLEVGGDGVSPYAAPMRAEDLAGLPPAYISVGDLDMFVDEDIDYAQRLMRAGVPCELHVYAGCFHGSDVMNPKAVQSRRWVGDARAALAKALAPMEA